MIGLKLVVSPNTVKAGRSVGCVHWLDFGRVFDAHQSEMFLVVDWSIRATGCKLVVKI